MHGEYNSLICNKIFKKHHPPPPPPKKIQPGGGCRRSWIRLCSVCFKINNYFLKKKAKKIPCKFCLLCSTHVGPGTRRY